MTEIPDAPRRSIRPIPDDPGLIAEAAKSPGGVVASIDAALVAGNPNGYVPPEAVRGCWIVGQDGRLTGEYEENPNYGTPVDDFRKLADVGDPWHSLLDDLPGSVRDAITELLNSQLEGSQLEWLKVTGEPEQQSAGRRDPDNDEYVILVRSALAVPFALSVLSPAGKRHILWGVFTWVVTGLDKAGDGRRSRTWLDLDTNLESAVEQLPTRLYEVDGKPA